MVRSACHMLICTLPLLGLHGLAHPPAALAAPLHREIRLESGHDPRLEQVLNFEVWLAGQETTGRAVPGSSLEPGKAQPELDPGEGGGESGAALGWVPHAGPFGRGEAAHLLNRTLYGPRFEEILEAENRGLFGTVNLLLTPGPVPAAPGSWATEPVPNTTGWTQAQKDSLNAAYGERRKLLKLWWTQAIAESPLSLTEMMTHFWHDHFATTISTVGAPQSVYVENDLFRQSALGNFKTLTRAVATDPAMLVFLDGRLNKKQSPNENFARELMELFTMGEGSGYTQMDVSEAARACTGWQTDGLAGIFNPTRYDTGNKTILGQTGPWGLDELIDIIFEQDVTAEFLCRKLYRWFIDDEPADEDIAELAATMRGANYDVAPVLRKMFESGHFMHAQFRGSLIRDGVDFYAGQIRRYHIAGFTPMITSPLTQRNWVLDQMTVYNHILLDPPDVSGWPGHRNWINSFTLPNRKSFSVMIVDGKVTPSKPLGFQLDVVAETARFSDPDDVYALINDLVLLSFGSPPTDLIRQQLVDELLLGEEPYNWFLSRPDAPERLRDLYRYVMRLPDYQLK